MDYLENKTIIKDMEEIFSRNLEWDSFSGKTFYVSGSYGMLASYIVLFLCFLKEKKGVDLRIIAQGRDPQKACDRFGALLDKSYFGFTNEDIVIGSSLSVNEADYVIHAAGIANPRFYGSNPVEVLSPNVIGTYNLIESCDKDRLKCFLFLSSCDVYGVVDNPDTISEETAGRVDPLDPHSCYSEGKRCGESILAAFSREYSVNTVMARVGHTYGPTMDLDNDPRVFASFMKNAVDGTDIIMHSDGLAKRAFCYISDAVFAYMLLLLKGRSGEAYNVTNTDQMISIKDLACIISKLPDNNVKVICQSRTDSDSYVQDKINKENRPVEKKLMELGWIHSVDASDGFSRVYDFFKG